MWKSTRSLRAQTPLYPLVVRPDSGKGRLSVCSSSLVRMNCNSIRMSESGSSGSTSGKLVLPIVARNPNSTLVSDAIGIQNNLLLSSDDLFPE